MALLLGLASTQVTAQEATVPVDLPGAPGEPGANLQRAWGVVPRVTLSETVTDNVALASTAQRIDVITEISPGIRIEANSARLRAHVDYQLTEIIYARGSEPNESQNDLTAFGRFEAIDDRAFVDFSGNIRQQAISAFGVQGTNGSSINDNYTEVATFSLSPSLTGRLGSRARYDLRYSVRTTDDGTAGGEADSVSQEWAAFVGGETRLSPLSWSVNGTAQDVKYENRRAASSDYLSARLTYALSRQFRVWGSAGRDANNFTTLEKEVNKTKGFGLEWEPGPRTSFAASRELRFFGNADNLEFRHRTPRAALTVSHRTGISELPSQLNQITLGTNFDILSAQLASQIPDPQARANAVNALLNASGISPTAVVTEEFLASQVTLQRTTSVALALVGLRNTITFTASRGVSESLFDQTFGDDFDTFSRINQAGYSAQWALRLSPRSAINALAAHQRTQGEGPTPESTTLMSGQIGFQRTLGRASLLSLAARRTDFEGTLISDNYIENSVTLLFSHRF